MGRDPPTAGRANGLAVIWSENQQSSREAQQALTPAGAHPRLGTVGITWAECKLTASHLHSQKSFLGGKQRPHRLSEPYNHSSGHRKPSCKMFRVAVLTRRGPCSWLAHGGPATVLTLVSLNPDTAFLSSLLPLAFHPSASHRKRAGSGAAA